MDKLPLVQLVYATPKHGLGIDEDGGILSSYVNNPYTPVPISSLKNAGKTIESLFDDVHYSGGFAHGPWLTVNTIKYRVVLTGSITPDVIQRYLLLAGFPEYVIHNSKEELEFLRKIWETNKRKLELSSGTCTFYYYTDGVAIE